MLKQKTGSELCMMSRCYNCKKLRSLSKGYFFLNDIEFVVSNLLRIKLLLRDIT